MAAVSRKAKGVRSSEGREDVAVAILAAGGGRRFGGASPKQLAPLGGRSLVERALDAASRSGLRPLLLVVGDHGNEVAGVAPSGVEIVHSPNWRDGIAASLRAALDALEPRADVGAAAVGLADQPLVGPEAYRRLAAAYDDGAMLAVATYDGQRANPVLIARSIWAPARALEGDVGARALMNDHPVTEVPCEGTGEATDVDTLADLAELEALCRSKTASE